MRGTLATGCALTASGRREEGERQEGDGQPCHGPLPDGRDATPGGGGGQRPGHRAGYLGLIDPAGGRVPPPTRGIVQAAPPRIFASIAMFGPSM
jgi:hypothetical protein